ncbi:MAG: ribosome maturation factor RimP [Oscillospiraceae bacterium]|nr:ribosome maturation factor RimP [Oscillospiraceae bacterium]
MATGKKPNTAAVCEELAKPVLEEMGLTLWDLRYEKEGSIWFLRYFIDKPGGVDINDCENFSRTIDKLLDEADPVDQSYTLEVSSPGIERELSRPWHFESCKGLQVMVRLIRPVDGVRDFSGTLNGMEGDQISLLLDEESEMCFAKNEAAYIRLCDDYVYGGQE